MILVVKDPNSEEPRGFDWTDFLAEIGASETISSSAWAITGPDAVLTKASPSIVTGGLKTQVILLAGTDGREYVVTNSIVTSSGVKDDRSFTVLVQQR